MNLVFTLPNDSLEKQFIHETSQAGIIGVGGWYGAIILGINAVIVNFLAIYSLQKLSASFVALVFLLDPILTGIFAWWIYGSV